MARKASSINDLDGASNRKKRMRDAIKSLVNFTETPGPGGARMSGKSEKTVLATGMAPTGRKEKGPEMGGSRRGKIPFLGA